MYCSLNVSLDLKYLLFVAADSVEFRYTVYVQWLRYLVLIMEGRNRYEYVFDVHS